MKFKYAESGIKKIFTAEILALIGSILLFVSGVAIILVGAAGKTAEDAAETAVLNGVMIAAVPALVVMAGAVVLMLISMIFNIIGVTRAANDEPGFKVALFGIIAGFILVALSTIFSTNGTLSSLFQSLQNIADLVALIYCVQGIRNLSLKLEDFDMDEKGAKLLKFILIIVVLKFLSSIIVVVFRGVLSMEILAAVFVVVSGILGIVQYFIYLGYLGKAKKMLAK